MRRIVLGAAAVLVAGSLATPVEAAPRYRDVVAITIVPVNERVPRGYSIALHAYATRRSGRMVDITRKVRWRSSDSNVQLSRRGRGREWVTGTAAGTATVSARWGALTASTTVTITTATLVAVTLSPSTPTIAIGASAVLAPIGIFSDGSSLDISRSTTWASQDTGIAVVNGGRVRGISAGSAVVTATSNFVVGSTTVTVTGLG